MIKVVTITVTLAVLFVSGCKSTERKEFIEFPVSNAISFTEVDIPGILAIPLEISIHRDKIMVWDQETDWFFKIFSFEGLEYLGSLFSLNEQHIPLLKRTSIKPDNKLLATAYGLLPIVRIYDAASGRLINEMHTTDSSENLRILLDSSADHFQEGLVNYYFRVKATNEYIYALYSGRPGGGMPENNVIHVWDWDGNPVRNFELSTSIESFDVSSDNKHIVAISMFEPDKIFRADIPWD